MSLIAGMAAAATSPPASSDTGSHTSWLPTVASAVVALIVGALGLYYTWSNHRAENARQAWEMLLTPSASEARDRVTQLLQDREKGDDYKVMEEDRLAFYRLLWLIEGSAGLVHGWWGPRKYPSSHYQRVAFHLDLIAQQLAATGSDGRPVGQAYAEHREVDAATSWNRAIESLRKHDSITAAVRLKEIEPSSDAD